MLEPCENYGDADRYILTDGFTLLVPVDLYKLNFHDTSV